MELIDRFIDNAKKLNVNVDSIVVEQNGEIEERVINNVELHQLRSCGKILIAMAYGVAMNDQMKCKQTGGGDSKFRHKSLSYAQQIG
ncbi:MAG: hypothetical protein K2K31_01890 [Clostridia bacterium]|nr:hypothetical protein [Clostridia bacterium]